MSGIDVFPAPPRDVSASSAITSLPLQAFDSASACDSANGCKGCDCDSGQFDEQTGEKIVCACFQVTESAIVEAVSTWNLTTVKELCRFTNAGAGCTACRLRLKSYLLVRSESPSVAVRR